jgi:hypothetical protein
MRRWLVVGLLVFTIGFQWGQANATQDADCQAVAQPNVMEFSFPIPEKDIFEWYQEKTADNDLEYAWQINLEGSETRSDYELGIYLYKYPGSAPRRGDFKKLLSGSQVSVWDKKGSLMADMKIAALIESDRLIIRVTDKATVGALMATNPRTAYFNVRSPYSELNFATSKTLD